MFHPLKARHGFKSPFCKRRILLRVGSALTPGSDSQLLPKASRSGRKCSCRERYAAGRKIDLWSAPSRSDLDRESPLRELAEASWNQAVLSDRSPVF